MLSINLIVELNMSINRKSIGMIFIGVAVLIFTFVILILSIPTKNIEINRKLNKLEQKNLFKNAVKYLDISNDLRSGSIKQESMVKFALSYMETIAEYSEKITYDEDNNLAIANAAIIIEIVNDIFDVQLADVETLGFKLSNGNIYITINPQGGDAKLYSYDRTEYNAKDNTYIAYVNILTALGSDSMEQLEDPLSSYSKENMEGTMMFKYKLKDDRKILLAFNIQSN